MRNQQRNECYKMVDGSDETQSAYMARIYNQVVGADIILQRYYSRQLNSNELPKRNRNTKLARIEAIGSSCHLVGSNRLGRASG